MPGWICWIRLPAMEEAPEDCVFTVVSDAPYGTVLHGSESMTKDLLLDIGPDATRMAIIEDGATVGFFMAQYASHGQNGSIYRGKVTQVVPGLQAAFVDIGLEKAGFLHARDAYPLVYDDHGDPLPEKLENKRIEYFLKAGQELTVQIVREATADKGPRVSTRWTLPGHAVMLVPDAPSVGISRRIREPDVRENFLGLARDHRPKAAGVVIRTAAEATPEELIIEEIQRLSTVLANIRSSETRGAVPRLLHAENGILERVLHEYRNPFTHRVTVNDVGWYERLRDAFAEINPEWAGKVRMHTGEFGLFALHGVETDVRRALSRKIWLKSGGWLMFDYTEAMTVVDVNSGKYTGKDKVQETIERINFESVDVLIQQVRLRNLGGIIVVDFIDMESLESRDRLVEILRSRFAETDGTRTRVIGMTSLGLVEMTRKKWSQPLHAAMGKGRLAEIQPDEAHE